jgi:hypothetical protein
MRAAWQTPMPSAFEMTGREFYEIGSDMNDHFLRFKFDERKGLEALIYMASNWPGITPFYASKVLFFAEKTHMNRHGRPIVADTFIAMENGPVPSNIYDMIKGNLDFIGDPAAVVAALAVHKNGSRAVTAKRPPDLNLLSSSDIECLDEAIKFCRDRPFHILSEYTHKQRAWIEAELNGPMDYEALIDEENEHRDELLTEAREFAAYGVL